MIKRIYSIAIVAMIAVCLASCTKSEESKTNKVVKINFEVADKPSIGKATRSIKKDWAVGDQIMVFLATDTQVVNMHGTTDFSCMFDQTITLEKTAQGWTATNSEAVKALEEGGIFSAVHYRGKIGLDPVAKAQGDYYLNYMGGEFYTCGDKHFLECLEGDPWDKSFAEYFNKYTISTEGDNKVIDLGTIELELPIVMEHYGVCQFSIDGLDPNEEWSLYVANDKGYSAGLMVINRLIDFYFIGGWTYNCNGPEESSGLYTGEDHNFWFCYEEENDGNEYNFLLIKGPRYEGGNRYGKEKGNRPIYVYTKTLANDEEGVKAGEAYNLPKFDYKEDNSGNWKMYE